MKVEPNARRVRATDPTPGLYRRRFAPAPGPKSCTNATIVALRH
jgi:hypothetical protein